MNLAEDLEVLRTSAGAARVPRDVVRVVGPEATGYLQGQLSQDVEALPAGASAWSFVLQPQGKVDVWMRVTRLDADTFLLDTDPGWSGRLAERLNRFKLRTKVEIEPLAWSMVSVRGPDASEPVAGVEGVVVAVAPRGDVPGGWDLLGQDPEMPAGSRECDPVAFEVLRIQAGIPRMGHEVDETTIPAETGVVAESASFTKGCYTGQELVARVNSRGGRAPRRVVLLTGVASDAPEIGTALVHDGADVGRVTSAVSDGVGETVALGLLARAVDTPCDLSAGGAIFHAVDVVEVGSGA